MALALESDDPDQTVRVAQGINPEQTPFATRQAAYWVDYGRALSRTRGRREDAVRAFRAAEKVFPNRIYRNPIARESIVELVERSRRNAVGRELRGLAFRAGVDVA